MIRRFWRWLTAERPPTVTAAWSREQLRVDCRVGWDGPVWRTPRSRLPLWDQKATRGRMRMVGGTR